MKKKKASISKLIGIMPFNYSMMALRKLKIQTSSCSKEISKRKPGKLTQGVHHRGETTTRDIKEQTARGTNRK